MSGVTTGLISCPKCGKRFRWSAKIAGRRMRCPCGGQVMVPNELPGDEPMFDIAPAPAPTAARPSAPRQHVIAPPTPKKEAVADPERIKNVLMPFWLLVGGVIAQIGLDLWAIMHFGGPMLIGMLLPNLLLRIALEVIVSTIVMLACVLIAAKARGIALGSLPAVVFKLAAISVAPGAAATLVAPVLSWIPFFGMFVRPLFAFVMRFALLGALFDLDESDTWYVVAVMFIVGVGLHFAILWLLHAQGY